MRVRRIKVFLRFAIAFGFLSAVADRFGILPKDITVWGNWASFIDYTQIINPWIPNALISFVGAVATIAEVILAICLIIGFKTELAARLSGYLMLMFALAMTFSIGIKAAFDYSVFTASAGAFALSLIKVKYFEIDRYISKRKVGNKLK
ncbi:MAG: DoxX family protein [Flavobacteriaceae bacterium]